MKQTPAAPNWQNSLDESGAGGAKYEAQFAELERALLNTAESFGRWMVESHACTGASSLQAQDISVMQVIGLKERPKHAVDIAKYLNRSDSANVLYGLRKLERCGLIEKVSGAGRQVHYRLTARGRDVGAQFARIRKSILFGRVGALGTTKELLEGLSPRLWLLAGFYEQATRELSVLGISPDAPGAELRRPARVRPKAARDAAPRPTGGKKAASRSPSKSTRRP